MDDTQDQFTKSTSEKRSVSDQEGDERSQKRVRVDDQQSSQLTVESTANSDNNSFIDIEEKTTGATIHDHDFDADYNEESDEDWAEGNESVHSEASSTFEMFHSASFGPAGADVTSVDYDEPTWTSFTPEECEKLQEEAKHLGVMKFMKKYHDAKVPVVKLIEAFNVALHPSVAAMALESQLWALLRAAVSRFMRRRKRLDTVNTLEDVVELLRKANNVMIVTGAGVSVSCGIPDFRSETGIYSRLQEFELDDPQQMFDIQYFRESPEIFYSFAKELYPSNYEPSPSHMFVKLMEEKGKLLRNYTQNIDTLEHKAGIRRIVNCHGSFATASCVTCGYKCDGKEIEKYIFEQKVPPCPKCSALNEGKPQTVQSDDDDEGSWRPPNRGVSVMKPDITFFGESLPAEFDRLLELDTNVVDLLIVMGSSLKVSPVSEIMTQIPHSVPQILINRTPITHMTFDIQLLGDCDVIVPELCRMLGWDLKHHKLPGGSALSDESWALSKQGDGDLVEIVDPETKAIKHKEQKVWKFRRDGLYTFPGAVVTDRYLEQPTRVVSSDDESESGDDDNDDSTNKNEDRSTEDQEAAQEEEKQPSQTAEGNAQRC